MTKVAKHRNQQDVLYDFTFEDKLYPNRTLAVKDNLPHPQNTDLCLPNLSGKFFPESNECFDCERT